MSNDANGGSSMAVNAAMLVVATATMLVLRQTTELSMFPRIAVSAVAGALAAGITLALTQRKRNP